MECSTSFLPALLSSDRRTRGDPSGIRLHLNLPAMIPPGGVLPDRVLAADMQHCLYRGMAGLSTAKVADEGAAAVDRSFPRILPYHCPEVSSLLHANF